MIYLLASRASALGATLLLAEKIKIEIAYILSIHANLDTNDDRY
jgi:hypothetical protein